VKKQLKTARDQIKSQPGAKIQTNKIDEKNVAGQKAPYFVATYPARNSRQQQTTFRHMQTVVENGPNYYWISYAAPSEVFKDNKDVFMHMLKSFRF
jgi:hypothetical protein